MPTTTLQATDRQAALLTTGVAALLQSIVATKDAGDTAGTGTPKSSGVELLQQSQAGFAKLQAEEAAKPAAEPSKTSKADGVETVSATQTTSGPANLSHILAVRYEEGSSKQAA